MSEYTIKGKPAGYSISVAAAASDHYAQLMTAKQRELDDMTADRDDWLQVSRDWRVRAESAEAKQRELEEATDLLTKLAFDVERFLSRTPAQPAAPEPSADTGDAVIRLVAWVVRNAEDLADVVGNDPDLLRDMAMAAKRVHGLSRAAEAQLAAVRVALREAQRGWYGQTVSRIRDLLDATPSPGAGEKT